MKTKSSWEEEFEKKFVIPNGHFHNFYYKDHPYKRELWTNYIAEPGLDELKQFISKEIEKAVEKEREKCREIFIKNVDWSEWAMGEEEAAEYFDKVYK